MTIVSCFIFQASTIDQGNPLSTQKEDPTTEQLMRDAQIENIDSAVQEVCPIFDNHCNRF